MQPKVFISYSWSTQQHQSLIQQWAERLVADGVDILLDIYDLKEGYDKYIFMEKMVSDPSVTHILVMCDKVYAEKADARKAGVGTESQIMSRELYEKTEQTKFIPIVCEVSESGEPYLPVFLKSRIWIDFSSEKSVGDNWERLIRHLFEKPLHEKPARGLPPLYIANSAAVQSVLGTMHSAEILQVESLSDKNNSIGNIKKDIASLVIAAPFQRKKIIPPKSGEIWKVCSSVKLPEQSSFIFWKSKTIIRKWCWTKDTIKVLGTQNIYNSNVFLLDPSINAAKVSPLYKGMRPFYGGNIIPLAATDQGFFVHDGLVISRWFMEEISSGFHFLRVFTITADRFLVRQKANITEIDLSPDKVANTKYPYPLFGDEYAGDYSDKHKLLAYTALQFVGHQMIDHKLIFWHESFKREEIDSNAFDLASVGSVQYLKWSPSSEFIYIKTNMSGSFIFDYKKRIATQIENSGGWAIYESKVAWHPVKDILAIPSYSVSSDNVYYFRLELLAAADGTRLACKEQVHSKDILCVDWSANGRYIATSSLDCSVAIWDLTTDSIHVLQGSPKGRPYKVEFSPDSQRLCVCGLGAKDEISIWSVADASKLASFKGAAHRSSQSLWHYESYRLAFEIDEFSLQTVELSDS